MKTTPFLEYVLYDVFGEHEPITARYMMGGHMLYYEGKPFALVEDETLYVKGSKESKEWYESNGGKQFTYIREGKTAHLYYFSVPEHVLEERDLFREWFDKAVEISAR